MYAEEDPQEFILPGTCFNFIRVVVLILGTEFNPVHILKTYSSKEKTGSVSHIPK
jgi:hypothetical protein